jgi:hypothetical protein
MIPTLAFLASHALAADEADFEPSVDVGGQIHAHYGYLLTDGANGYNEFALDRTYLDAKAKLTRRLGARLTLDSDRFAALETDTGEYSVDTKYRPFVKFAYLEWKDFAPGLKLRAGLIDTPYTQVYDAFWEHRYVSKGMADDQKLLDTADFGVSVMGTHADGLLDWHASLNNGEGYGKAEVDSGKSLQARVTVDALAKGGKQRLPITGFVNYDMHKDADATLTWIGAAGYKMPFVWVWGEYVGVSTGAVTGSGFSASLLPGAPKYARAILRYDHFDPNGEIDGDGVDKLIGGVSHTFAHQVSGALTYERVTDEATPDTPAHGMYVRWQAGF